MAEQEKSYAAEWRRIADKDLNRTARALSDSDPELAGYCLQQAVEKYLKAFLLSRGWPLRRIHDLEALLDDAVGFEPGLDRYRPYCQKITKFYMLDRYPALSVASISADEIQRLLDETKPLISKLQGLLR